MIEKLVAKWPTISGRSIKQLIKLAKVYMTTRKKVGVEVFEQIAKFQDLERDAG